MIFTQKKMMKVFIMSIKKIEAYKSAEKNLIEKYSKVEDIPSIKKLVLEVEKLEKEKENHFENYYNLKESVPRLIKIQKDFDTYKANERNRKIEPEL